MTKMYAMLYKRELLSEDYYVFLPCHYLSGEYDASDKSITDLTGNPFYDCSNYPIITSPVDLTYYYDVTEEELLNMYQVEDIKEALSKYYDSLKKNILIGKINNKNKNISIQNITYNYIEELLAKYKIDVKNKRSKVTITRAQLSNIINLNDIVLVKKELGKLLDSSKFMEAINEKVNINSAKGNIGTKNLELDPPKNNNENKTTKEEYEKIFGDYLDNKIDIYSDNKYKDTYDHITKYLIGQDKSIETLVSVMLNNRDALKSKEIIKPFIIGQTGSGKTYFFELLGQYLDIPVIVIDCNLLVQSGYEGQSLEDMLKELYIKCNKDIDKTEKAIVFLDEVDKLASRGAGVSDVGVQKALLSFIAGHKYVVELDRLGREKVVIDTSMMSIAAGGAFEDLVISKDKTIGFTKGENTEENLSEALVKYGMIRELIGRFGTIVKYNDVTKEMLVQQLNDSLDSPILINKEKFERRYGINLTFSDEFIDRIVEQALKDKTGFRGTSRIINEILIKLEFNMQYNKEFINELNITEEYLDEEVKQKKIGTK